MARFRYVADGRHLRLGADTHEFGWAVDWILEDHRPVSHDE
jgi:hypothetical protein